MSSSKIATSGVEDEDEPDDAPGALIGALHCPDRRHSRAPDGQAKCKLKLGNKRRSEGMIFRHKSRGGPQVAGLPLALTITLASYLLSVSSSEQTTGDQPVRLKAQAVKTAGESESTGGGLRQWDLNEADADGLYLLGLFDVHTQASARAPLKCGPIDVDSAASESSSRRPMQNLAAFQWAIDQVNADSSLLPGIKLGSLVLDTCSSFLRTNQQLANLLHSHESNSKLLPQAHQIAAIVADQRDWQSVEATASMASALGITTFVTQTRSTKLNELARRYASNGIGAQLGAGGEPGQLQRRAGELRPAQSPAEQLQHELDERLLGDLLGIGRMMTTPEPQPGGPAHLLERINHLIQQQQFSQSALDSSGNVNNRLLMVRMLLNNEIVADSIASLCDHWKWDLISVVYDSNEPDLIDLHDELIRQLFLRNTQLALDEQVQGQDDERKFERLLLALARKAQFGARAVVTLLSAESARNLQRQLHKMRLKLSAAASQSEAREQLRQLNSLVWISTADREPYYSLATDSLGLVSVAAGTSSLVPEFKRAYDSAPLNDSSAQWAPTNKWWPEYLRAILVRQAREQKSAGGGRLELLANECAKWLEPRTSPLHEKCRELSLRTLLELEQSDNNRTARAKQAKQLKIARYLAGGWEHNGMAVINSVLAAANGLESLRQTLCPEQPAGMCTQMRLLVQQSSRQASAAGLELPAAGEPLATLSELMFDELTRSTFQLADRQMFNLDDGFGSATLTPASSSNPTGGELNLMSPSAQFSAAPATQLEAKVRFYNLRFLRPNLVGFVKFAHFDARDGLTLANQSSEALHYKALPADFNQTEPLERVKSTCLDGTKCLLLSSLGEKLAAGDQQGGGQALSEEELAEGVNSLFKLDHPLISAAGSSGGADSNHRRATIDGGVRTMRSQWATGLRAAFATDDERARAASSERPRRQFEVVVLLPLHSSGQSDASAGNHTDSSGVSSSSCAGRLDEAHAFQQLAALAYAQARVNDKWTLTRQTTSGHYLATADKQTNSSSPRSGRLDEMSAADEQPELLVSVIDYCDQLDLVEARLMARLASPSSREIVALVDFDSRVSKQLDRILASSHSRTPALADNLLHLSIAQPTEDGRSSAGAGEERKSSLRTLKVNALPTRAHEIEALVRLASSVANFRLVHLIYADRHEARDEFIRRANEANICVSKLIWVPEASAETAKRRDQVAMTRQLFERELFDYSKANSSAGASPDSDLSATRVLVVLASAREATNQLILEAATDSMLRDYVWLTTHEWLNSVEVRAEQDEAAARRLPRQFLSTMLESADEHQFKHYFAHLTPALHAPIPTDWFDQFWQQHFNCRLPLGSTAATRPSAGDKLLPACRPDQRLESSGASLAVDERVHFIVRAIESLHLALGELKGRALDGVRRAQLARDFRSAFDTGRLGATDWNSERPLVGFHYVHRLLAAPTALAAGPFGRRSNSRQLESDSASAADAGHLVRVGLWRHGSANATAKSSTIFSLVPTGASTVAAAKSTPTSSHLDGDTNRTISAHTPRLEGEGGETAPRIAVDGGGAEPADDDELQQQRRIERSLGRLAAVKSRCSSEQTCAMCKQQIAQTLALIDQQEARLRLAADANSLFPAASSAATQPRAISSLDGGRKRSSPFRGSSLDSAGRFESNFFTERDDGQDGVTAMTTAAASGQRPKQSRAIESSAPVAGRNASSAPALNADEIQAAASSLFDARTSQQVADDTRRAYAHLLNHKLNHNHSHNRDQPAAGYLAQSAHWPRHYSGALVSALSLLGICFTVASMTYFYPNLMDAQWGRGTAKSLASSKGHLQHSFRSTTSSTCHIIGAEDEYADTPNLNGDSETAPLNSTAASINDYLLLMGLLMLFSINIAFQLPATLGVCHFRRLGLSLSYTLLFSAMLVRILSLRRQASQRHESGGDAARGRAQGSKPSAAPPSAPRTQLEPVDESVEVTFESLPHDLDMDIDMDCDAAANLGASYQQQVSTVEAQRNSAQPVQPHVTTTGESVATSNNFLQLPVALICLQSVVSLVWLARQPPEPTLYLGCWHCASPSRSPLMFHLEPLLSLGQPSILLLIAWLYSAALFKCCSRNEHQYRLAIRRLLTNQPLSFTVSDNPQYARLRRRQHQLAEQVHESKALVMTSTLLLLVWSAALLVALSAGPRRAAGALLQVTKSPGVDADPSLIVYLNLVSGALIFALLFIYRLNLFNAHSFGSIRKRAQYNSVKSSREPDSSTSGCLVFCCLPRAGGQLPGRNRQSFAISAGQAQQQQQRPHKFNGSPVEELISQGGLKLQQFSSYGTYSPGGATAAESSTTIGRQQMASAEGGDRAPGEKSKFFKSRKKSGASKQPEWRRSNGSVASSAAKLAGRVANGAVDKREAGSDLDSLDRFDTLSCASNSTSQLQGNELYPIDCSIQLDAAPSCAPQASGESSSRS